MDKSFLTLQQIVTESSDNFINKSICNNYHYQILVLMLFHEFNVLSLPFLHLESLTHFDLNKTDTFFYNTCTFKTIDICALSLKIAKVLHRLFSINFGILLNGKTNMIKSFFWLSLPQYIKTKARYFLFNNFIYFSFLTAI